MELPPPMTFATRLTLCRPAAFIACGVLFALAAPALAKEHKVAVDNIKYSPKELKVKKGDTVVWTNSDDRDHTVTADDGSFASKKMASGDTYSRKFSKA